MANFDSHGCLAVAGFEAVKTASTIGLIIAGAKLLKPVLMPALQQLQAQGLKLMDEGLNELNQEMEVYAHGVKSAIKTDKNLRGSDIGKFIDTDDIPHG